MLAYRDGELAAFEALYARHRARLYRYVLHQVQRREAADDLFQDIWRKLIDARVGYQPTAKFSTWLYRIAHHRVVDHFRADGRLAAREVTLDGDPDDGNDGDFIAPEPQAPAHERPESMLERRQLAARLLAAVEALPHAQRESFLLAAEGGLSVEEIGQATGAGYETAKSRLRYAYGKLRTLLADLRP